MTESFTIATCAAGEDAAPYHNLQPVLLLGSIGWINRDPADLLQPTSAGPACARPAPPEAAAL